jgi:hypothetical protein
MHHAYCDDLCDFIRNQKLDCYELTDEELMHFFEVWRWTIWTRRRGGADFDVFDATNHLQAHMAQRYGVHIDYNTLLLLRQEAEPLMHWRIVSQALRSLLYFVNPLNWLLLWQTLRRVGRYQRMQAVVEGNDHQRRGYPKWGIERLRERCPDLLRRTYWRQIGAHRFEVSRCPDLWW